MSEQKFIKGDGIREGKYQVGELVLVTDNEPFLALECKTPRIGCIKRLMLLSDPFYELGPASEGEPRFVKVWYREWEIKALTPETVSLILAL